MKKLHLTHDFYNWVMIFLFSHVCLLTSLVAFASPLPFLARWVCFDVAVGSAIACYFLAFHNGER